VLRNDFVVRFAGEGGQGVVTAAEALAQAAAQVGYNVQTFATFPSQIEGGPTWAQARISTTPVLNAGDDLDILVAFNQEAYENHKDEISKSGVIIYNSGAFQMEEGPDVFGLAIDELAKSTGNPRAANFVVIGAVASLVGMPDQYLVDFNKKKYTRGRPDDEVIVGANNRAIALGREGVERKHIKIGDLATPQKLAQQQILIKGNDAISIGSLAAGLDTYIGYPISPATPILVFMERSLVGPGKFAYQASSEIEAIVAIIGAGYSGKKAMTATSGPGFSLMSEALGLAWMAEIPCVVVDVQRGGPATGLPTKTEQSDFQAALHPAHGDVALPVIAPGTVEECFYAAVHALNWAERYQGPVMLLSEMAIAERTQNIPEPDVTKLKVESRKVYTGGANGYLRYDGPALSPMPLPGGPGAYVANASEHDGYGDTTHLPMRHVTMSRRRFSKLKLLEDGHYEREHANEPIAIMPWGGSKGPAQEAYQRLAAAGKHIAWYYTMFLHPLPPKLLEELRSKELVIVPELNFQGQFSSYLRSLGVKAESIIQYTGLPFKPRDLVASVNEKIKHLSKVRV